MMVPNRATLYQASVLAGMCLAVVMIVAFIQLTLTHLPVVSKGEWEENNKLMQEHPRSFMRCNRCVGPEYQIEIAFLVISWPLAVLGIMFDHPVLIMPWMVNVPLFPYVHHRAVQCALTEDSIMNRWPSTAPKVAYLLKDYQEDHLLEKLGLNKTMTQTASSGLKLIDPAIIAAELPEFPTKDMKLPKNLPVYWNKKAGVPTFWDVARGRERKYRDDNIWRCPYAVHNRKVAAWELVGEIFIWLGSFFTCGAFVLADTLKKTAEKEDSDLTDPQNADEPPKNHAKNVRLSGNESYSIPISSDYANSSAYIAEQPRCQKGKSVGPPQCDGVVVDPRRLYSSIVA